MGVGVNRSSLFGLGFINQVSVLTSCVSSPLDCAYPDQKEHTWLLLMLLFALFLLLIALFPISEHQPGGRCFNIRTADQRAMMVWHLSNKWKAKSSRCRQHKVCTCAFLFTIIWIICYYFKLFWVFRISNFILIFSKLEAVILGVFIGDNRPLATRSRSISGIIRHDRIWSVLEVATEQDRPLPASDAAVAPGQRKCRLAAGTSGDSTASLITTGPRGWAFLSGQSICSPAAAMYLARRCKWDGGGCSNRPARHVGDLCTFPRLLLEFQSQRPRPPRGCFASTPAAARTALPAQQVSPAPHPPAPRVSPSYLLAAGPAPRRQPPPLHELHHNVQLTPQYSSRRVRGNGGEGRGRLR